MLPLRPFRSIVKPRVTPWVAKFLYHDNVIGAKSWRLSIIVQAGYGGFQYCVRTYSVEVAIEPVGAFAAAAGLKSACTVCISDVHVAVRFYTQHVCISDVHVAVACLYLGCSCGYA